MHILIEDYKYPLSSSSYFRGKEFMDELDSEFYRYRKDVSSSCPGSVSFNCVGYYFSKALHDCVIVLPKVLIVNDRDDNKQRLFLGSGNLTPQDVFDLDALDVAENQLSDKKVDSTIRQDLRAFAIWIYRALSNYSDSNPKNSIISKITTTPTQNDKQTGRSGSLLEVILELLRFNRDNQGYFSRIIAESKAGARIKWNKTINRNTPIIQNGQPYYTNPVKLKSRPNFEEELIVIYFSILNYVTKEFGFPHKRTYNIETIPDIIFKTYLAGRGTLRLRQIKSNYFSNEAIRLWTLCMAFFNEMFALSANPLTRDQLLAKSFHHVFEDMVDFLIGDHVEKRLRTFGDGRQLDHIYRYTPLIGETKSYYIGDSKYYPLKKEGGQLKVDLPSDSMHKQYDYALNVQQLIMEDEEKSHLIFDETTEGYGFIPNFFISGSIIGSDIESESDHKYSFRYNDSGIVISHKSDVRRHFKDRLFDRSTLKLFYFNVNFMYVLKAYALGQRSWKEVARSAIRKGIQSVLLGETGLYEIYKLSGKTDKIGKMTWRDYKTIAGKIIKTGDQFYMALRKPADSKKSIEEILKKYDIEMGI